MAEHTFTINTLNAVVETLKQTSCDALIVHVQNALRLEQKRARGRAQANPQVRKALMQEREMELADYARKTHEKQLLGSKTGGAQRPSSEREQNERFCVSDAWSFNEHPRSRSAWRP